MGNKMQARARARGLVPPVPGLKARLYTLLRRYRRPNSAVRLPPRLLSLRVQAILLNRRVDLPERLHFLR